MSDEWIEIVPGQRAQRRTKPAVSVACRKAHGKQSLRLVISIGAAMRELLGWEARMRVSVARNPAGDRLRIRPTEGPAAIALVGTNKSNARLLTLHPLLEWSVPPHEAEPAECEADGSTLVLTLPAWARRPAGRALPAAPQTPPPTVAPPLATPPPEEEWTEARLALLREIWPQIELSGADVLARLNALPGAPLGDSVSRVYHRAKTLGLPHSRMQAAEAAQQPGAPPPEPVARHADLRPRTPEEEDIAEAKVLLRAGRGARFVADEFGWELSKAQKLAVEVRREMEAEAAARALSPEAAA